MKGFHQGDDGPASANKGGGKGGKGTRKNVGISFHLFWALMHNCVRNPRLLCEIYNNIWALRPLGGIVAVRQSLAVWWDFLLAWDADNLFSIPTSFRPSGLSCTALQ